MKLPWFKKIGIFYIPQNAAGCIIVMAGIIYAVFRFIKIDSRSHSVSDTLRPFVIELFIIFIAYNLIAFIISSLKKK